MKSKNFDINTILSETGSSLLTIIYKSLLKREKQIILECGVNKGYSTSMFSYYSEKSDSYCFSIDINDCKDVVTSERWTFIHNDDSKVLEIINDDQYTILTEA